jgi:hypothetical protein
MIICSSLLICSLQIKWDIVNVVPSARGELNTNENYWTGGLIECDTQCQNKNGSVCGQN